jgi:hypothetical protein
VLPGTTMNVTCFLEMEKKMKKYVIVFVLCAMCVTSQVWAVSGQILSWASTGEGGVYGLGIREAGGSLELHMVAQNGQVYRFGATSLGVIKDGSQGSLDSKTQMMSSGVSVGMLGLAVVPTYEGAYGLKYVGIQDNVTKYQSIFGVNGEFGNMGWAGIDGAWCTYAYTTDITSVSRSFSQDSDMDIWTVNSTNLGNGTLNAIYRYTNVPWKCDKENYVTRFIMSKALQAVALGENNDLWVLCKDNEVLNVSSIDGSILDRFFIDNRIDSAFGMEYSTLTDSLWITNQSNCAIYQVAVPEPATIGLVALGLIGLRRKHQSK